MMKVKTVESTGKITVSKSEERYPYASEILMRQGFWIIFLNMALGLLPVTIWGTRIKYFKCSISQVYTTFFCLCFIFLSVLFVPVVFFPKADDRNSVTNLVILVAMGMLHTVGYICLLVRGHFIARKIPLVWTQLSKLVQIVVLDVYGTSCYLLHESKSFAKWALFEYLWVMGSTMSSSIIFSTDYTSGITESVIYYKLHIYVWPPGVDKSPLRMIQWLSYNLGYFIWQLCSSCHVLVTMLLCYMVIIITVCLKSINQQICEIKENTSLRRHPALPTVSNSTTVQFINTTHDTCRWEHERVLGRLDAIGKAMLLVEEITQTISVIWGISLIIEALILIGAGTVNVYNFLAMFQKQDSRNGNIRKFSLPKVDEWIDLFVTVAIHFFFLFKLASRVSVMINEANKPLHLLKQIRCDHLPQAVSDKVQTLKQDLASTSISITATNFFQVNKFLITSITSQIATYVIVLLQFAQQEMNSASTNPPNTDYDGLSGLKK